MKNIVVTVLITSAWIVFCIISLVGFDGEIDWVVVVLFGLFSYASFMLWRTVLDRHPAPLEMMFWLYNTNFYLLPAVTQTAHRKFFWSAYDRYSASSLMFTCFVIFLGLFSFGCGAAIVRRAFQGAENPLYKHFNVHSLQGTWPTYILMSIISMVLTIIVMKAGIAFFVLQRMDIEFENALESAMLLSFPRAIAFAILLFSLSLVVQEFRNTKKIPIALFIITLIVIGLNMIINYPLALARFWLFGFILALMWTFAPLRSAIWRGVFIILISALQFIVLPIFSNWTRGEGVFSIDITAPREYLLHGDFDGYQATINAIMYIDANGFEFGRNILSEFLFFVPRSFWANKAEALGVAASDYMGYTFTNLSAPIYCEMYADLGLVSLVLGMGLLGFIMKYYDNYYSQIVEKEKMCIGMLTISVLSGYLIILLRGSLLAVMPPVACLVGILVFLAWVGVVLRPRSRVRARSRYRA